MLTKKKVFPSSFYLNCCEELTIKSFKSKRSLMDIFFALNGEQIDNRKIGKTKTFLRLFFIKIVIIFNGN